MKPGFSDDDESGSVALGSCVCFGILCGGARGAYLVGLWRGTAVKELELEVELGLDISETGFLLTCMLVLVLSEGRVVSSLDWNVMSVSSMS